MPFEAEKRTTKLPNMEVAHICAICLAELLAACGRSFQCPVYKPSDGPNVVVHQALSVIGLRTPDAILGPARDSMQWCCRPCFGKVSRITANIYKLRERATVAGKLTVEPLIKVQRKIPEQPQGTITDEMNVANVVRKSPLSDVRQHIYTWDRSKMVETSASTRSTEGADSISTGSTEGADSISTRSAEGADSISTRSAEGADSISTRCTEGADFLTTIKQEPDDDIPQTASYFDYTNEKLSHLSDHSYCKLKHDIHVRNIPPAVASSGHESYEFEADTLALQSERDDTCNISEALEKGTEENDCANKSATDLYEVKDVFLHSPHTEIVHSDRHDCESQLVEVPGELDCQPNNIDNMNSLGVLGDVNIQTTVQCNDRVIPKLRTLVNINEATETRETTLDSRVSSQRIPCCPEGSVEPVDEKFSHRRSDVELPHCSNNNKQLYTQDDVIVDVHENTSSVDNSSILCNDQFYERPPSNKSFSCTQCEIRFMSIEELTSHCVVHKEAAIHQYRNCDKTMTVKDYTMAYNGEHPFQLHGSADCVPHKDLSQKSAKSFSCTRCNVCNKTFATKSTLKQHARIHTGERPFQCIVCNKRFPCKSTLRKHARIHTGELPFQCNVCDKKFKWKSDLKLHVRLHTGERPFQCSVCNKRFPCKSSLRKHSRIHTGERLFQCNICDKFVRNLERHLFTHTNERPFPCNVCKKTFKRKYNLTVHKQIHTGERPFQCNICNKKFAYKSTLKQHARIHTGERPFQCNVCNKRFSWKSTLRKHARIHTGERPFQCIVCNKRFPWKSTLRKHARIHNGERPFQCSVCNKRFSLKSTLRIHARIHTGERPFQCSVCNKRFSVKSTLRKHTRIHTGERPFHCTFCDKNFASKSNLKEHALMHTGERPFQCNICGKFARNLKKHLFSHTDERPFPCNVCNKTFKRKQNLTVHKQIHTGERPFQCNICKRRFRAKATLTFHLFTHTDKSPYQCNICDKRVSSKSSLVIHGRVHSKEHSF